MDKEKILNWWFTPCVNSNPYIYVKEEDGIYEIHKFALLITKDKNAFICDINYPKETYDIYKFDDYGKTWAFTVEELKGGKFFDN